LTWRFVAPTTPEARRRRVLAVILTGPSRCLTYIIAPASRAVCSAGLVGVLGVAVQGEQSDVVVGAAGVDAVKILSGEHERR
jgi:hypothetical protein